MNEFHRPYEVLDSDQKILDLFAEACGFVESVVPRGRLPNKDDYGPHRDRAYEYLARLSLIGHHLLERSAQKNKPALFLARMTALYEQLGLIAKGEEFATTRSVLASTRLAPHEHPPGISSLTGQIRFVAASAVHRALWRRYLWYKGGRSDRIERIPTEFHALHLVFAKNSSLAVNTGIGYHCGYTRREIEERCLARFKRKFRIPREISLEDLYPEHQIMVKNKVDGYRWNHAAESELGRGWGGSEIQRFTSSMKDVHVVSFTRQPLSEGYPVPNVLDHFDFSPRMDLEAQIRENRDRLAAATVEHFMERA